MTTEQLQARRDELILKIAKATRRLQAGDTSIEYQGVADMQRSLAVIDAEIARVSGASRGAFGTVVPREGL